MSGQRFDTIDQLRLDIEADPPDGELRNLIRNPSGDLGAWGWITPTPNTALTTEDNGAGGYWLRFTTSATQDGYLLSEPAPVTPGHWVAARMTAGLTGGGGAYAITQTGRYRFLDADGLTLIETPASAPFGPAGGAWQLASEQVPAGAAFVQLRVDLRAAAAPGGLPPAGSWLRLREVAVATATTTTAFGSVRTNMFPNPSLEGSGPTVESFGVNTIWSYSTAQKHTRTRSILWQRTSTSISGGSNISLSMTRATVQGGRPYLFSVQMRALGVYTVGIQVNAFWYDAADNLISYPSIFGDISPPLSDTTWTEFRGQLIAPAAATSVKLVFTGGGALSANKGWYIDSILIEQTTDAAATYFDGSFADAGDVDYAWSGAADNSWSTATVAATMPFLPVEWIGILGTAHQVTIERAPLDVGLLTGQLRDAALDPSASNVIRPGRRCMLVLPADEQPVFSGTLREANVSYDLREPNVSKRARVTFEATDAADPLANAPRPDGVATIAELPHVLEGAGVPWNVNGSRDQVAAPVVVAVNDNATALDQLAITRDSALGQVWIDRHNVVQARDEANLDPTLRAELDEATYTDLQIDYDTDRCINVVTVKFLRTNPGTDQTEEVTYGPYRDEASVREWGARQATFTVQWADEDAAAIESYALAILAANATPAVRVNSATLPLRTTADLENLATLDLLDLVHVVNAAAGIDAQLRVQGISHAISARRWTLTLTFARDGQVATPQYTPSPSGGAGGLTLSELLRPVGEVTMFYGTQAQIPVGWLECNGASYSTSDYPKLAAHLAIANPALPAGILPDWNDRFPVGASTAKPLASIGGASSVTMPDHTHGTGTIVQSKSTNTATGGSATRVTDISGNTGAVIGANPPIASVPPYRAIRFIIRGR